MKKLERLIARLQVAVDAEMAAVKALFPKTMPTGGRKTKQVEREADDYIRLLNFAPERLTNKTLRANPDGFQIPLRQAWSSAP